MKYLNKYGAELESLIAKSTQNPNLLHKFLVSILSPSEYTDLSVRWQIVKQLKKGVSQRDIAKSLHVSISTVTRGSREMLNRKGGFAEILKKYYSK